MWKATDRHNKAVVAVKKIFDAFQNATDAQRTYREIIFLQQMNNHENIIGLKNLLKAENDKDIYLVFEFMETDLHAAIRANILEDVHKQYIVYQSFKALKFMHSAGLVHRDMKPANLLLNAECLMKVADFGLARSVLDEHGTSGDLEAPCCTDYVATRWYRAPEILVGSATYGQYVDMWSMGCIFGEMLLGKPIFTGTTTLNQIEKIAEHLGTPTSEEIDAFKSSFAQSLFDSVATSAADGPSRSSSSSLKPDAAPAAASSPASAPSAAPIDISEDDGAVGAPPAASPLSDTAGAEQQQQQQQQQRDERQRRDARLRQRWSEKFPDQSDDVIDLLHSLMCYHPDRRLSAAQALEHGYCSVFHDPSLADNCEKQVTTEGFPDNEKKSVHMYREKIYKMVDDRYPAEVIPKAPRNNESSPPRRKTKHAGGRSKRD